MNRQTIRQLNSLAALCTASSRGYAVAGENVRNRGLKVILQAYARERAAMAQRLDAEITRLGGKPGSHRSVLAALHRGWINLKATMVIGADTSQSIVLDEVARGERTANKRFQAALDVAVPDETRQIIEECSQRVQDAYESINQLRGVGGEQLVLRLVDGPDEAARAVAELQAAGFSTDQIEIQSADELMGQSGPVEQRGIVRETVATTALLVGGAGTLLGVVMAVLSLTTQNFDASTRSIALLTAIAWPVIGALVGILFGAIVGGMLGEGIREQDSVLTADLVAHGDSLVTVECEPERASQASDIMYRVNVVARSSRSSEITPAPAASG
ncbi:MAG: PA2169 family four-helix-bundle protein [Anaerolineae bacterium]|nr:PA2169 family four-helix-bundle protein [Anaerolineae bacterium]MCB0198746.1 PA2169 family four-helix-bundle protein [Anaerolineae bacterium]